MRILLLSNKSPWPPHDGGSSATWCLITGLIEKKVQVTVLALNTSKHFTDPDLIPSGYKSKIDFNLVPVNTNINPIRLLINLMLSHRPYSLARFKSDRFSRELSMVLSEEYDIIQLEGLAITSYLSLIRELNRAKVVFRPHNIENHIWLQLAEEEENRLKRWYLRVLAARTKCTEQKQINDFDALVTLTPDDMEWFRACGLSKPSLINPPGFITKNTGTTCNNPLSVFFIGALDWRPNINGLKWFLKYVWPIIVNEMPQASFTIAGRNAGKKLAGELTGKNVLYYGEVDSSGQFIAGKCIMVVPLFSGSGIRMKILEGMSMGKCVVSTPMGAAGISCEDRKDIFLAGDPKTFAEAVLNLLKDEGLRQKTGKYAIENVRKNYNNLATIENLLKFYSDLT